ASAASTNTTGSLQWSSPATAASGTSTNDTSASRPGRGGHRRPRPGAWARAVVMAAECARAARPAQAPGRSVVAMDRVALGIAAELEPRRVTGEEVGAVAVVEPPREQPIGHEHRAAHRIAHQPAPAHRVVLETRARGLAREAVDLAVHPRAEPRVERAEAPGIDRVVERAAHVLDQEFRRRHGRGRPAGRAASGDAGADLRVGGARYDQGEDAGD